MLNEQSGLQALAGSNDMAELLEREKKGDDAAKLAVAAYVYRIRKYIGSYLVALGHVDAIIFTAGVGENSAEIRLRCCQDLELFGIKINSDLNVKQNKLISDVSSAIKIMVIHTNEELQIALEARQKIMKDVS